MSTAQNIVQRLLEADPDAVDPQHYLDALPARKIERWVFTDEEWRSAHECNSFDELVAEVDAEIGVTVYRNGEVANRWEDGTVGVPENIRAEADAREELYSPDVHDWADIWRDVYTNEDGQFLGWVEKPSGPL